uniref:Rootletin-like coiled-coil domain-containing protein n=1 Tax=Kryptolebias marmoratus TaxID=37003 RepID=A0A3Q3A241_KRYMA
MLSPSLSTSLHEEEQRWKRKLRVCREKEARQALLIHRLQNKVSLLEEKEHTKLIRDEHSDSLESALIRLEEEQQRCVCLNQSEQTKQVVREDLQKLTADWTKAVEEAEQREADWQREKECQGGQVAHQQARLLSVWRSVVDLRRHCHTVKTAADRDLWNLRAQFSRFSSSLLSSCSSLRLNSTPLQLLSSSTLGIFSLEELKEEQRGDKEEQEETLKLKLLHETEVLQLEQR